MTIVSSFLAHKTWTCTEQTCYWFLPHEKKNGKPTWKQKGSSKIGTRNVNYPVISPYSSRYPDFFPLPVLACDNSHSILMWSKKHPKKKITSTSGSIVNYHLQHNYWETDVYINMATISLRAQKRKKKITKAQPEPRKKIVETFQQYPKTLISSNNQNPISY